MGPVKNLVTESPRDSVIMGQMSPSLGITNGDRHSRRHKETEGTPTQPRYTGFPTPVFTVSDETPD